MNICLIGYGIPSLVLANILANRNIKVSIFDESKLTNKSNTRTLGIAKKNIEFLEIDMFWGGRLSFLLIVFKYSLYIKSLSKMLIFV